MKKRYFLFALLVCTLVKAQNPAAIDLTFNFKDEVPVLDQSQIQAVIQSDGKIIVVGNFTKYNKYHTQITNARRIMRLNSNLTVDETFNTGNGFNAVAKTVALTADGKIIVGGNFTQYNGITVQKLARLNADGSLDPTFVNTSIPGTGNVACVKVQSDGKILVGGNFINGATSMLIRLDNTGSLDTSFTLDPTVYATTGNITVVEQLSNGKILAGGNLNISTLANRLAVFNTNGTLDTTFNAAPFTIPVGSITIQPDNKILVTTTSTVVSDNHTLKRLNPNGSVDSSFNMGTGFFETSVVNLNKPVLQTNGDIVIYGRFTYYNGNPVNGRVRIHANGSFDNTYNYQSNVPSLFGALSEPNGDIFGFCQAGFTSTQTYGFNRLDANGNLPDNQQPNTTTSVCVLYKKANGEIITMGSLGNYNGNVSYHAIKLMDQNGNLIYNSNLKQPVYTIAAFPPASALQPDGKLLVCVLNTGPQLIRLNTDYSIDTSFNVTLPVAVNSMALQADGKILIPFRVPNDSGSGYHYRVQKYNSDSSLDVSFTLGSGTNNSSSISNILSQTDGKIIVSGSFTSYNGVARNNIVRLNADGSVDTDFNPQSGRAMAIQSDGKILISLGTGLARLNSDGSVDSSFSSPQNIVDISVYSAVAIQPDGKILLGGVSIGGYSNLVRLNSDGSLDNSFDTGIGFDPWVSNIVVEPDGRILVGGTLNKYNGTYVNGLVRLVGGDGFVIQGQLKYDSNENGCDASDIAFPNMKFNIASETASNTLIVNSSGNYAFTVAPGTYTITPVASSVFSPTPASFTVTFPAQSSPYVQDFCLNSAGNHPDLEILIVPLNAARPGFDAKYKVIYKNKGNQLQSGAITVNFDDAVLDLTAANPSVITQNPGVALLNFTNLSPLESRELLLTFNLNTPIETPALNAGSVLNYTATVTSSLTDETPNDNTTALHQTVVNSFDPNDKTCLEGTSISTSQIGDYVHYVIRFENKGTYNAQNISVIDVIDTSKFDINTLTPLAGSHLYVTRITQGNKVEFYFEDINLPFSDATNDGYVVFKIKTKSTLAAGDTFSNNAAIYFDYNTAVDTNTATTAVGVLATTDFAFENYFTIYPNPANSQLNIAAKQTIAVTSIEIYNTLGQLIIVIPQNTSTVDVSGLKAGNYFIRINSQQGTSTTKFIKL